MQQIIVDRFLRSDLSHSFKLNAYERILLVMLASYTGKKEDCFPSHQSLSLDCGMSTDSVGRYAKLLEKKKLIIINRVIGNNNLYKLNIPTLTPTADSTHCSQLPPANSDHSPSLIAVSPPAESGTNNISNNIKKSTSLFKTKKGQSKSTNKTIFPQQLVINESHEEKATKLGLDVSTEFEHFKEHHIAKGNTFADWGMAFHTWLRNASKFKTGQQKKLTNVTDIMAGVGREKF